jgi:hypothetical protein
LDDQIEKNEMGRACSTYGCIQGFGGETKGKRPLGRPKLRWEDNIKMDLQEMGGVAWYGLMWLRIGTGGGLL